MFTVPQESRAEFVEAADKARRFIKTLPGFVEGYIYEQKEGPSHYNFLTTAVWESEEAFENAKKTVISEYQKQGYDPIATAKRLGIESVRSTYERSAY